jgi:hypothetical protein
MMAGVVSLDLRVQAPLQAQQINDQAVKLSETRSDAFNLATILNL